MHVRVAAAAAALLFVAGCAALPSSTSTPVVAAAPDYRTGDRWVYHVDQKFYAAPDYDETHEVIAVDADGVRVRVSAKGGPIDVERVEQWRAPGLVTQGTMMDVETRRFNEPLERFRFPLVPGTHWSQRVAQVNDTLGTAGIVSRYVQVNGTERVTTPAGTFDAVRMTVFMRLDDETPFRQATECTHIVWYAPAVRGVVRESRRATWREKGSALDQMEVLSQNEVAELVAFTPGR
jgi:hypothetical protein